MKTHVSIATRDVERAVKFYSVLLDTQPVKHLEDYALFVTDDPGLELAIDRRANAHPSRADHFGIWVESLAQVERAIQRLQEAGLAVDIERDEVCCYARQTKVWATDPDGRRWETYHVFEETDVRDGASASCCQDQNSQAEACCAG
jgi:catechol 2,3-dioxygenase-like lactoylglutathione lyase family enzyme